MPVADEEAGNADFDRHFRTISRLMHRIAGVHLTEKKRGLVRSRLGKRIRELGLAGFGDYVEHIRSPDGRGELATMIDVLTTNKTSFFRETPHFRFLARELSEGTLSGVARLRLWSAGCSTGEEPYSLALLLQDVLSGGRQRRARILATDINSRALRHARRGAYPEKRVEDIPDRMRSTGFRAADDPQERYRVRKAIRSKVRFARLNLLDDWPMDGPFHAILCRNVMIYFDGPTREKLVRRFTDLLARSGYLFCGLSESLNGCDHDLEYVQPAVYRR